jgi:hypothetical protein
MMAVDMKRARRFSWGIGVAMASVAVAGQNAAPARDARTRPIEVVVDNLDALLPRSAVERAVAFSRALPGPSLHEGVNVPYEILEPGLLETPRDPRRGPPTRDERLTDLVCDADAVVFAHAVAGKVVTNALKTGLITIFRVTVHEWVRPAPGATNIAVGVFGGRARVAGREYVSPPSGYQLRLDIPTLMFLRSAGVDGAFVPSAAFAENIDDRLTLLDVSDTTSNTLRALRAAARRCGTARDNRSSDRPR